MSESSPGKKFTISKSGKPAPKVVSPEPAKDEVRDEVQDEVQDESPEQETVAESQDESPTPEPTPEPTPAPAPEPTPEIKAAEPAADPDFPNTLDAQEDADQKNFLAALSESPMGVTAFGAAVGLPVKGRIAVGVLQSLVASGLVARDWKSSSGVYSLTDAGRARLQELSS